jgi:hypothetical protein
MHLCQCDKHASCRGCDVPDAKEYPCRANGGVVDQDAVAPQLLQKLVGFVHPSDAPHPISQATKFLFKVYASSDDDDTIIYERSLPPLGPWSEHAGSWVLDPELDDALETAEDDHDAAMHDVGGGGYVVFFLPLIFCELFRSYSSVACTGVTHDFDAGEDIVKNWDGHRGGGYMSSRQNVCVFDNLCVGSDGELTMFLPPRVDGAPKESVAYNEEENHIGYIRLSAFESWEGLYSINYNSSSGDYPGWRPAVRRSPIPATYHFASDADLHIFQRHTHFYQHFGHLLLDDMLSAFTGMELFSLAEFKATLVLMPNCPCCFPETASKLCAMFFWNSDSIAQKLFHGGAKQSTVYDKGTCFKKVMMGHSSALSLVYPNPLLSVAARKFRSSLVMSVVGEGIRYQKSQWLKGRDAALVNISKEQVRPVIEIFVTVFVASTIDPAIMH